MNQFGGVFDVNINNIVKYDFNNSVYVHVDVNVEDYIKCKF